MARIEYDPFAGTAKIKQRSRTSDKKSVAKPRQEICAPLKWTCFFLNCLAFLTGITALTLGIYLCFKDPRPVQEWADFVFNPAYLLIIIGIFICFVCLFGIFGSLRDNIFLLKSFALCVFFFYILVVMATFLLFVLFYSDTPDGISAHSILLYFVRKYHTNRNLADFVDYLQEQMECCGVSSVSQGFRDWHSSPQFNCSTDNPYPEKCGVPFSCCKRTVVSEAAGSINPLLPAMHSLQCWQNVQTKQVQDAEALIYVRGCLQPLRLLFENHAIYVGAIVATFIIPVCFLVCLTHLLARQIDYQRYLLEREERQFKRRQRRERQRLQKLEKEQQPLSVNPTASSAVASSSSIFELPPQEVVVHPAGKKDRQKRRRAVSTSPIKPVLRANVVSAEPSGLTTMKQPCDNIKSKNNKRRRSDILVMPPLPAQTSGNPAISSSTNLRTHQWVLQQSDLMGKV